MASIRPDMMNKCQMQLFRKRPRMASIRPDMMKKCQMQLFLKTASNSLERPQTTSEVRLRPQAQMTPGGTLKCKEVTILQNG